MSRCVRSYNLRKQEAVEHMYGGNLPIGISCRERRCAGGARMDHGGKRQQTGKCGYDPKLYRQAAAAATRRPLSHTLAQVLRKGGQTNKRVFSTHPVTRALNRKTLLYLGLSKMSSVAQERAHKV